MLFEKYGFIKSLLCRVEQLLEFGKPWAVEEGWKEVVTPSCVAAFSGLLPSSEEGQGGCRAREACPPRCPFQTLLGTGVTDSVTEMGEMNVRLIWKMNSCSPNGLPGRVVEPTERALTCWRIIGANHLKCAPLLEL